MGFLRRIAMSVRFNLEEKVVYPSYGVATVYRIVEKTISGKKNTLYELKFLNKDMTILVPTNNLHAIGIRSLSSSETINEIFKLLSESAPKQHHPESASSNWKHRNKEYQIKLRRGGLGDISEIYRDLKRIEQHKQLSFCENELLMATEKLLVEEISLVKKLGEEKAIEYLRSFFGGNHSNNTQGPHCITSTLTQNIL